MEILSDLQDIDSLRQRYAGQLEQDTDSMRQRHAGQLEQDVGSMPQRHAVQLEHQFYQLEVHLREGRDLVIRDSSGESLS